jgi:hypothetical protein
MSEEEKGKGFVFVDKRKSREGEAEEKKADDVKAEASKGEKQAEAPGPSQEEQTAERQSLPEIDFNSFILSLSSSAMMNMGVIPNPMTKEIEKDLPMAKQTIDILAMMEKKTKGNLTGEEEKFLSAILYDLRMKFVEESKK